MKKLDVLFNPKTIAVIGATNTKRRIGYRLMKNLVDCGYESIIYPINPKHTDILGMKSYPCVSQVPRRIDLAIIATPAKTVPAIVEECGQAGVRGLVIITSGFRETGEEGRQMFDRLQGMIKKYDMSVLGPNCLGFLRPPVNLNASLSSQMALPGNIAFISQSGALGAAILDWSATHNVGLSCLVSVGSMMDIGFHDLIDYFGQDPKTSSILIFMESLGNARRFLSAARAFARTKPIIVLKVGKSAEGAKAAMSHTGSLTGNDEVFDAAFKRAGVLRVNTIGELFDCAQALAMQKRPRGNRLAIITNAGGLGVIATDYLIEHDGVLAKLSPETINKLNEVLSPAWSKSNPVDVLGDANEEHYRRAVELCLKDPGVDGLVVILTPPVITDSALVAKAVVEVSKGARKTVLSSWIGEAGMEEGRQILKSENIPVYRIPEYAVRSFLNMYQYSKNLELLHETPETIPQGFIPHTRKNKILLNNIIGEGRTILTEDEALRLLANYGIPVTRSKLVTSAAQAARVSSEIGFPIVMKVVSADILHKADVGGVKLNIKNAEEAKRAFNSIMRSVKKHASQSRVEGILVQEMVTLKHELLIASKKDPIFGPVISFGMGGVAVEVFQDVNVGLPPLNMILAQRLIEETKIYKLLKGYRKIKGVNIKAIEFLLHKFAYLVMDFPEIKEIDINPFAVGEKRGVVLDVKVVLDEKIMGREIRPYSHLVISPYPKEYIKETRLKNGRKIILRPVRPEDEPLQAEMFKTLSKQTQHFRFFSIVKDITHELLIRYTQVDYDREIAIIAEVTENRKRKMAGVVRFMADPYNETAEFAIIVADPWQGQGLGSMLTDYILEIARKRDIKKVYASVLLDNYSMLNIFRKRGFSIKQNEDIYYAELTL